MKVLKTIIATAVIVFALTTVAMAGVQHFTKQGGQATGSQARAAQPTHTVTLTAAQLTQLMHGSQTATTGVQHARHTQHHAAKARRHSQAAQHHTSSHHAADTTHSSGSSSSGTHHYEATHHASSSGSGTHHAQTRHSGDCGDGEGSCGD